MDIIKPLSYTHKHTLITQTNNTHCSAVTGLLQNNPERQQPLQFDKERHDTAEIICLVASPGVIVTTVVLFLKGICYLLFASLSSFRKEDRSHSFNCVCSDREETGRARPPLISLA